MHNSWSVTEDILHALYSPRQTEKKIIKVPSKIRKSWFINVLPYPTLHLSSALPQDHPQGHQTLQPAAGWRRSRQDRRLWCEQRVWGLWRPPVEHGGDASLHGPRDDDRTRAELQRKGESKLWLGKVLDTTHLMKMLSCEKCRVYLPGIRRVGNGSHTLLFCLWKGEQVQSQMHLE